MAIHYMKIPILITVSSMRTLTNETKCAEFSRHVFKKNIVVFCYCMRLLTFTKIVETHEKSRQLRTHEHFHSSLPIQ